MNHEHGPTPKVPAPRAQKKAISFYLFALVFIVIVGVGGYLLFFQPFFGNGKEIAAIGLLGFAVIAGIASFFSPCGISLLPAYFSIYFSSLTPDQREKPPRGEIVLRAVLAALGLGIFIALLGGLAGIAGQNIQRFQELIPIIRRVIGVLLVIIGFLHFFGKGIYGFVDRLIHHLPFLKARGGGAGQFLVYGFGYGIGGAGCSLAILGSLFLASLVAGGFAQAFRNFTVAGLVMMSLMVLVSLAIGFYQNQIYQRLLGAVAPIQKLAGLAIIGAGLLLILIVQF